MYLGLKLYNWFELAPPYSGYAVTLGVAPSAKGRRDNVGALGLDVYRCFVAHSTDSVESSERNFLDIRSFQGIGSLVVLQTEVLIGPN